MEYLTSDPEAYSEYMDDYNYSQGFYVTPAKDGSVMLGGIRRVTGLGEVHRTAESAAVFAVEEHSKEKAGGKGFLKFMTIVNLNVEPAAGALYYITALVADAAGDICRYQMKIWEKLNTGYQVQIFRQAPYSLKLSEKLARKYCCVEIKNLLGWMDENYLYYKCFLCATEIAVIDLYFEGDAKHAYLWFRNSAQKERIVKKYGGKKMPHSDIFYTF
ncbi:hypothetical protein AAHA92_08622 [Salvia divinorum]|uniref:Cysteine proteinase inhibitor n=1 Tax=Salvia divinorum TaxID=28513 RepID=A0ABD1HNT1_SALDI